MSADYGEYTVWVFLDLSSVFDIVNHNIMINRLHDLVGMSGSVLGWFSYLSTRCFNVFANQIMSEATRLSCEVPQGSVLDPLHLTSASYHLYADDILLIQGY